MPLYSLVPLFRPLLAPVPRLRFRTDTHTDRQTHTQDNYRNPPAHARRGLITVKTIDSHLRFHPKLEAIIIYTLTTQVGCSQQDLAPDLLLYKIVLNISLKNASWSTMFLLSCVRMRCSISSVALAFEVECSFLCSDIVDRFTSSEILMCSISLHSSLESRSYTFASKTGAL